MTEDDENLVRNCMNIRFGRKNLEKTRFGTSTQKCEATNRGYNKSNPKDITFQKNFPARIHSTAHKINHRPGESAVLNENVTKVDNSKVISVLRRQPGEHIVFERYTDKLIRGDKNTYIGFYMQIEPVNYSPEPFMNIWSSHQAVRETFNLTMMPKSREPCVGEREKVVCTMCKYESLMYPLYEEIGEEGKKAGKQVPPTEGCKLDLRIQVFQILHGAN
ncbi:unnamed protein product [Mytilus coruscus]|uniref:Uncharacterized protein n=1 Tax=Mytilus coruscus TaxID=42192 RepID=A0A6J8DAJ8_MYTCO|nr:unnamed protein product [Mytilus coruscus]